jgi:hypothetical protein
MRHALRFTGRPHDDSMTVSRKGKRRIVIGEREFLWWVAELDECFAPGALAEAIHVVSPEGAFQADLQRQQNDPERSYVTLRGEPGGRISSGRFRCPVFETTAVTPRTVRTLIEWVFDPAKVWLPVDCRGRGQTVTNPQILPLPGH